jgi:hypothetical protein
MKKKLFAISVACGLSFNLAAEAPGETNILFGAPMSLVIEENGAAAGERMCTGNPSDQSSECWAPYRALVVAHIRRVQRHGSWT